SDPSPIVVAASVTKLITCDTDPTLDGAAISITGTTSGGNGGAYTYALFNNATATAPAVQTGAPFTDIDTSGDYWVVATDAEGCTSAPLLVNVPDAVAVTFSLDATTCYSGAADATITVNIGTGNGNYSYSLNDGTTTTTQNTNIFTGLTNGNYTVTVTDGFNCSATDTVTINPQVTAVITKTDIGCTFGSISFQASGGDTNYVYQIFQIYPGFEDYSNYENGTFTNANYLSAPVPGRYYAVVRDNGGVAPYCEYKEIITINQIDNPTIVVTETQPDCNGGQGSAVVVISDGTADYTTTITLQGSATPTQTSGPGAGTNITFNNLAEGTYDVVTTDANNCATAASTITITAPDALAGSSRRSQDYTCTQQGEITVENVTGG
ncbi:hypothetical protein, partial [Tenacibaculum soleae]|uniref:hypothetical protein n=1 Tax=Tenacibaculum soleae TaxID=447689 RepID=UPI0026E39730